VVLRYVTRKLKCTVCARFRSKILSKRNFSDQWIFVADSICTCNICGHASSEQHSHCCKILLQREAAAARQSSTSSTPIVIALIGLSEEEKVRLKHKFDIVYWLVVE